MSQSNSPDCEVQEIRLRCRVQRHLVAMYEDGDSGDWVFVCCRSGLSRGLGRPLRKGEELLIGVSVRELEE